mmetsp:Transcript_14309/g.17085  ORF Transcript_14309/g.17085 Transcript_14309/m.17085 type:complete len:124 (+) Transcript_14309:43-414(+)
MAIILQQVDLFHKRQSRMVSTITKLTYVQDIQSSLNIQDELDREWVSLFGKIDERTGTRIASNEGQEDHSSGACKFTLNRQCMSCKDNMSSYLNLFKIACVNYISNPVTYQNKQIKRQDLLSL